MEHRTPKLSSAHIVFVNNFAGPGLGGGEVQLLHLVRACVAAGMRVTLVVQRGCALAGLAVQQGAALLEVDFALPRVTSTIGALRAVAASADIVQGTGWWTNALVRLAGRELPHVRVVNLVHVMPGAARHESASPFDLLARLAVDRMTGSADKYVAVSDAVASGLIDGGVDGSRVVVIRNGVDSERVRGDAEGSLWLEVGMGSGPMVGCIARLEPVKGVEHFVRAAISLSQRDPIVRFAIAGGGSLEPRLREIAFAGGVSDQVSFLGHVSPIEPLLGACEIIVLPSLSEGLPMVALEAMALGKPVVASRVGGLPEAVEDGVTGLLVEPGDPSALAAAIGALLDDPDRARKMGEAGRARVERDFTLERMTSEYLALYAELV